MGDERTKGWILKGGRLRHRGGRRCRVVVASVAFFGWRGALRRCRRAPTELRDRTEGLICDATAGRPDTGLGGSMSGTQIDGATCDEQLVFEGVGRADRLPRRAGS